MLAEERHNAIVEEVNANGSVKVKELAVRFGVTEDCIRKDLTQLEKRDLLKKAYGGAVRVRKHVSDYHIADRLDKNIDDKRVIARKALELIDEGETVFLDMSTSNIELAKLLVESGKRLTVVSNCLEVMAYTRKAQNIKLIALGGEVDERCDGFIGAITNEQIEHYSFDTAFIGVVGVDLENDRVSTYAPLDGITKAKALSCAKKAYMMLETRKLEEDGNYWYAHVSDFTGAVMEKALEGDLATKANEYMIEWLS